VSSGTWSPSPGSAERGRPQGSSPCPFTLSHDALLPLIAEPAASVSRLVPFIIGAELPGFSLIRLFRALGPGRVAAPLAPLRPRCSTVSNSEEYEVESSAASKALEPTHPGSTAVVPEPSSPLRSTSFPGRRRGFRPRWSPRVLPSSASGRTMTRRTGTTGCSTSPGTSGSREIRSSHGVCTATERRSGAFRCSTPPGTGMPGRAGSSRSLPRETHTAVAHPVHPFHVTGISKKRLFGQCSRRPVPI
jgi:hypothetical protein